MSRMLDLATAIQQRLAAWPALAGIDVLLDRQLDVESLMAAKVAQGKGAASAVFWAGAANRNLDTPGPLLRCRYTVSIFARPVLRRGSATADDLAEAAMKALHHWIPTLTSAPDGTGAVTVTPVSGWHAQGEIQVISCDLSARDERFVIYEVSTEANLLI
jgi:hypothetical protein